MHHAASGIDIALPVRVIRVMVRTQRATAPRLALLGRPANLLLSQSSQWATHCYGSRASSTRGPPAPTTAVARARAPGPQRRGGRAGRPPRHGSGGRPRRRHGVRHYGERLAADRRRLDPAGRLLPPLVPVDRRTGPGSHVHRPRNGRLRDCLRDRWPADLGPGRPDRIRHNHSGQAHVPTQHCRLLRGWLQRATVRDVG